MTIDLPKSWQLTDVVELPSRSGVTVPYDDLPLTPRSTAYLVATGHPGLWQHQHIAIGASVSGQDVCLATPTASGKTLVFHVSAIEAVQQMEGGCVLALYPTKALAEEQEHRWRAAMVAAGFGDRSVARIDGSVAAATRVDACRHARVIVATPDIVHAWMLPKLGQRGYDVIARFLERLTLLVVDEVHAYSGVFGTNSSFLFRRLAHVRATLGGSFRILGASATIADPARHASTLFGRELTIVSAEHDSSPRHSIEVAFLRVTSEGDFTTGLSELFVHLADTKQRFMAFFDSRKMAEQAGAIVQREGSDTDGDDAECFAHLEAAQILPYRAGYESEHRALIQRRLTEGRLAGVLCTSAMELGLDIKGLDVVVLVGVPHSGTSLHQRIGRVGRAAPGLVLVVHSGSVVDDIVFAEPSSLLTRPLQESAIYLDSARIQYIHAMCIARPGGEHDQAARTTRCADSEAAFPDPPVAGWPAGFHALCIGERGGAVPTELRDMKREAQDMEPAHAFPLRDVETQFTVELKVRGGAEKLGSLSHAQVMREAYPGAVYYYAGRPHRVVYVNTRRREVQVVRSRRYTTQPITIGKVAPQREVYRAVRAGDLLAAECDVKIRRAVLGYRERRGQVLEQVQYPLQNGWSLPAFSRELFTTGVVLAHPLLDVEGIDSEALCAVLREAFFLRVPLDRQDLDVSTDRLAHAWAGIAEGSRILVLHDQTYGSLRLSGRLMDDGVLEDVLRFAGEIVATRTAVLAGHELRTITPPTRATVEALVAAVTDHQLTPAPLAGDVFVAERPRVLLPQSQARSATRPGSVFEVHRVFVHITHGLSYRGVWIDAAGRRESATVRIDEVEAAPEAKWGLYDADGDEVVAA